MKPILFNTEMVKAILRGDKTVTRRAVKPQPAHDAEITPSPGVWCGWETATEMWHIKPPYQPGDILYVRETWNGLPANARAGIPAQYWYKADEPEDSDTGVLRERWRPSIHMPRDAARIFLRVTDVWAERLWGIGLKDALAEGVTPTSRPGGCKCQWAFDGCMDNPCANRDAYKIEQNIPKFIRLWDSTVKPADRDIYGWAVNPWVWIIEFERISREEAEHG